MAQQSRLQERCTSCRSCSRRHSNARSSVGSGSGYKNTNSQHNISLGLGHDNVALALTV